MIFLKYDKNIMNFYTEIHREMSQRFTERMKKDDRNFTNSTDFDLNKNYATNSRIVFYQNRNIDKKPFFSNISSVKICEIRVKKISLYFLKQAY